jgi:hypothetical protein
MPHAHTLGNCHGRAQGCLLSLYARNDDVVGDVLRGMGCSTERSDLRAFRKATMLRTSQGQSSVWHLDAGLSDGATPIRRSFLVGAFELQIRHEHLFRLAVHSVPIDRETLCMRYLYVTIFTAARQITCKQSFLWYYYAIAEIFQSNIFENG